MRQIYPRRWQTDFNLVMEGLVPAARRIVRHDGRTTVRSRGLFIGASLRVLRRNAEYAVRLMEEAEKGGCFKNLTVEP